MSQPNNPLHGVTLETVVTRLVEHYGWEELGIASASIALSAIRQ